MSKRQKPQPRNDASFVRSKHHARGAMGLAAELQTELAALRSENEKLKAALETIQNGARSQGPFEGMSWRDVDVICEKVLGQLEEPQATPSDQQGSEVAR